MRIETKRLTVRDLELKDAVRLHNIVHQTSVMRFMRDWSEYQKTVEDTRRFIEWRRSQMDSEDVYENRRYAIAEKNSDVLIGIAGTGLAEDLNEVEMAYFLDEAYQKKGYATEATAALSEWYLKNTSVPYLILTIDCANGSSCRVAELSGFEMYEKRTPIGHSQPNMESDSYYYYRKYRQQ